MKTAENFLSFQLLNRYNLEYVRAAVVQFIYNAKTRLLLVPVKKKH